MAARKTKTAAEADLQMIQEEATTVKKTTAKRTTKAKEIDKAAENGDATAEPKKRTRRTKKAEPTVQLAVQFAGKSYTNEELVKIAKDVWQYDLKQEEKDLTAVELYVKPEESVVYYVFNGTEEGKFFI